MTEKRLVNEVDHLASVLFTDGYKAGSDHMTTYEAMYAGRLQSCYVSRQLFPN